MCNAHDDMSNPKNADDYMVDELFNQTFDKYIAKLSTEQKDKILRAAYELYIGNIGFSHPHDPDIVRLGAALFPSISFSHISAPKDVSEEGRIDN